MATFRTQKLLTASASQIPQMAEAICADFQNDGFEVTSDTLMSGGQDISITKGDVFKAVLGMRSALKITLTPQAGGVFFDANVGIFGQQALPTVISMFFFWPVLLTQIWGLIQQSSLDDRALATAERVIARESIKSSSQSTPVVAMKFCTKCGAKLDVKAKYCNKCGAEALII